MNQDTSQKFKKNVNTTTGKLDFKTRRELTKSKIMEKFDISSEEAELILIKIENRNNNLKSNRKNIEKEGEKLHNNVAKKQKSNKITQKLNSSKNNVKNDDAKNLSKYEPVPKSTKNVDELISNFVPDSTPETSIELNHVDLTFEVDAFKIDTLKEAFIRTVRKEKMKKIEIKALKDVTFKINKGEKIGIIGYNGAGKSTLLNVITGIYPPDKGTVKTYGKISPLLSLGAGFDPNYSGRKNIYLNGAVLGYDKEFLKEKEHEIIEFSELEDYIDLPIKNYSSGMLAKLGFSIATLVNPDILIIDEILGVGDATFARKSADKIRSLMDGKTTVLLVSHAIPQIRKLCDKAIWIHDGQVKEIGEVNAVCDHYLKDSENASRKQLKNIQFK